MQSPDLRFEIEDERVSEPTYLLQIYRAVVDLRLHPNTQAIYLYLHKCSKNDKGQAWPSYATMGEWCFRRVLPKASSDTLRRMAMAAVKELLELGLIRRTERWDEAGDRTSNSYTIASYRNWNVEPEDPATVAKTGKWRKKGGGDNALPLGGVVITHHGGDNAPKESIEFKNQSLTHSTRARVSPGRDAASPVRQSSIGSEFDPWHPVLEKMRISRQYGQFFEPPEEARLFNICANRGFLPSDVLAIWDMFDLAISPNAEGGAVRKSLVNWLERERRSKILSEKGGKKAVDERKRQGGSEGRGILKNGFSEGKTSEQLAAEFWSKRNGS